MDIFEPYKEYSALHIVLEVIAVMFGVASVFYSKQNNIKVYPTGIISTLIFVYLLYQWELFGDMIINGYYLVMSVYGWYLWKNPSDDRPELPISLTSKKDYQISALVFLLSSIFVCLVYVWYKRFGVWWSYIDILTTGLFFVGMYLLAKRKVEHWILLIVGDFISIPLYYFKGYTITAILFLAYTVIATLGYLEWKKIWKRENP